MESVKQEISSMAETDIQNMKKEETKKQQVSNMNDIRELAESLRGNYDEDDYGLNIRIIPCQANRYPNVPLDEKIKRISNVLKRNIEMELRNKTVPDIRNITTGKFDKRNISKLAYGSPNVMMKSGLPSLFDGCIYILKDGSGSMDGIKEEEACRAIEIIEAATKTTIPLKIVTFRACGNETQHEIIKDWEDRRADYNYTATYHEHTYAHSGNKDGYSIRIATKELLARPEKQKLFIICSDGLPTDYKHQEYGYLDVKNAVAEARANGIFVCSIYFGEAKFIKDNFENYKYMYDHDFIGCEAEQIPNELKKILKKFVRAY